MHCQSHAMDLIDLFSFILLENKMDEIWVILFAELVEQKMFTWFYCDIIDLIQESNIAFLIYY